MCRAALELQSRRRDITAVQRATLREILDNDNGEFDVLIGEALAELPEEGLQALDSETEAIGAARPLFEWLTNGGAAWLWAVAMIVAQMFGLNLPPLPPLPPPPKPS